MQDNKPATVEVFSGIGRADLKVVRDDAGGEINRAGEDFDSAEVDGDGAVEKGIMMNQ